VCGAVEKETFNVPLTVGDAFHNAIEAYALGQISSRKAGEKIKEYFHRETLKNPSCTHTAGYWSRIAYDQFLAYCQVWAKEDASFESLAEEQSFCFPYTLPSGRVIYRRGKIDGIIQTKNDGRKGTYLFEHKIKGEIDAKNLGETLAQNLQVMFYMPPAYQFCEERGLPKPDGVLYNVIQRPLSGRKHSIKQKKGRKVKDKKTGLTEIKGAETGEQYYQRLAEMYPKHPEDFFFRWRISISEEEVTRFNRECLDPMLEQMCDWWDSIQGNPMDPWNTDSVKAVQGYEPYSQTDPYPTFLESVRVPNKLHYRTPFGMFNKLAKGLVGDYQAYLTKGDKTSLQKITTVFPELK
jgi:hypothetical protein